MPGYLGRARRKRWSKPSGRGAGGAALRAGHAEHRQADERAHDQLRHARLGHRQGARLSLSADASGDRRAWPPIPDALLELWREVAAYPHPPEACLVNFYADDAKMGLHQDRDEADFAAPVVSVSLGDACLFRVGQTTRDGPTVSFRLESGDVVVLGGEGRLASTASTGSIRRPRRC